MVTVIGKITVDYKLFLIGGWVRINFIYGTVKQNLRSYGTSVSTEHQRRHLLFTGSKEMLVDSLDQISTWPQVQRASWGGHDTD